MKKLTVFGCAIVFAIAGSHLPANETLPVAPEGSFSIVVIPDSQAYVREQGENTFGQTGTLSNPVFVSHVRWIAENIDRQKIAFVSHVGDICDTNAPEEWKVAVECMDVIHGLVPYGISVGNHDMTDSGDSTLFQKHFPQSRFQNFDWYGGCYQGKPGETRFSGNNANSYQQFSAGGVDFLFLHLECNAPDDVLDWANQILAQHPDRKVLITSHMGWGPSSKPIKGEEFVTAPKGRMQWTKNHGSRGNSPQQIWEKCYRKHPHLLAIFSGDQRRTQTWHTATPGDHGNIIHEILQDYMQEAASTGWLRLIRFLPQEQKIQVYTFNSATERLCNTTRLIKDRDQHQFEFTCDLTSYIADK